MRKELAVVEATPYLVRVETNGRFHIRYEVGDRSVDDGRCGIDENWVRVSVDDLASFGFADADIERLCQFCFPREGDE